MAYYPNYVPYGGTPTAGSTSSPTLYNWQNPQYISTVPQNQNVYYWVQGEEGAKAYPVGAGNTVMLMDSDSPVMYKKYADQSGRPILETYDLVLRQNSDVTNTEYVKRDELSAIIADAVRKELNNKKKFKENNNG